MVWKESELKSTDHMMTMSFDNDSFIMMKDAIMQVSTTVHSVTFNLLKTPVREFNVRAFGMVRFRTRYSSMILPHANGHVSSHVSSHVS